MRTAAELLFAAVLGVAGAAALVIYWTCPVC